MPDRSHHLYCYTLKLQTNLFYCVGDGLRVPGTRTCNRRYDPPSGRRCVSPVLSAPGSVRS